MQNTTIDPSRPVVLVVDDEEEQRKLLHLILQKTFHVYTAGSGEEALAWAEHHPIDVALVDYRMGEMSGATFLTHLAAIQPEAMRFMVTAYADSEVLQEAINVGGVYRFVQKPIDPEILAVDIQRALEHRESQRTVARSASLAVFGVLAGQVIHDLRNSLQVIAMVPAMLQTENPDNIQHSMRMLARAEEGMRDLVEELLVLARGHIPTYSLAINSLQVVVEKTIGMIEKTPLFEQHPLQLQALEPLPQIALHPNRIERMLVNLLRNAAQAAPPGTPITVALYVQNDLLYCSIHDEGPGIRPELHQKIFEPLYTTKQGSGLGLGLSICRAVMLAHHGNLYVDGSVERGTTFVATFPIPS